MQLPLLLATVATLRARCVGREVAAVRPVGGTGLQLVLYGGPEGLRLDTAPDGGALFATERQPPRLRGGRGAWPDAVGAADRWWSGSRIARLDVVPSLPAVSLTLEGGGGALFIAARGRTSIAVGSAEGEARVLGRGLDPDGASELFALDLATVELDRLTECALADPAGGEDWERGARELLPAAILEPLERPGLLEALGRRLAAPDAPALLAAPAGAEEGEALASWAGRLAVRLEPAAGAGSLVIPSLARAVERWGIVAAEAERLAGRKSAARRALKGELRRVRRALAAIEREESSADEPATQRRRAEALLAAPHEARTPREGLFEVPDPYGGDPIAIAALPGEKRAEEAAERLFAKARKGERGALAREKRRKELTSRLSGLEEISAAAASAESAGDLDALDGAAERQGLTLRLDPRASGSSRGAGKGGRREGGPPARAFVSPSGLTVLCGRSARQNDRLTFRVARPDDLWLHAKGYPGAHVVLRREGRGEVAEEDILFAARVAAAFSGAPDGEPLEVHVCRRAHVRRPKGAPPGAVLVKKGKTVQVVAGPPPAPPSQPGRSR